MPPAKGNFELSVDESVAHSKFGGVEALAFNTWLAVGAAAGNETV